MSEALDLPLFGLPSFSDDAPATLSQLRSGLNAGSFSSGSSREEDSAASLADDNAKHPKMPALVSLDLGMMGEDYDEGIVPALCIGISAAVAAGLHPEDFATSPHGFDNLDLYSRPAMLACLGAYVSCQLV